jgi:hypothetical protein
MADFNSALPIRTELVGQVVYQDVITKLGDATNPATQQAEVDTFGSQFAVLRDAAGNAIGDQLLSASYWLQSVSPSNGPTAPGTAAGFSNLIGGQYNGTLPTLTTGEQAAVQVDANGRLWANVTNLPTTVDTNYGVVGASTLRSAAQIGNAAGAADFNFGAAGAQTLRVAALLGNASGVIDYNYGAVDAQTVRTASQIGNATGAADFNNGATDAQTLRVAANLAVSGANVTTSNPVPVTVVSSVPGTNIQDYHTSASLPAGSSVTFTYTVVAAHTFNLERVWSSASGKIKTLVQNNGSTIMVGFNSTANPNIDMTIVAPPTIAAGNTVTVTITNNDLVAFDVYATIEGNQN